MWGKIVWWIEIGAAKGGRKLLYLNHCLSVSEGRQRSTLTFLRPNLKLDLNNTKDFSHSCLSTLILTVRNNNTEECKNGCCVKQNPILFSKAFNIILIIKERKGTCKKGGPMLINISSFKKLRNQQRSQKKCESQNFLLQK